jgi:signal transduction histidine kinase
MDFTPFFLGMAVLQLIFVTYQYILFKRKEFIYYFLYGIAVTVFICFNAYPQYNPISWLVLEDHQFTPGRSVLLIGYAMYFKFGRYFTETPLLYPKINRMVKVIEWVFLTFGCIDIPLLLFGFDFYFFEPVSKAIYLTAMPFSLYIIYFLITRKRMLTTILVIGSGLLLVFASAGFIDAIFITKYTNPPAYYLAYIEAGIFFEFVFLNFGLIYKTRLIQKENMKLEIEKQVELYKQRMRISNDLHDEVGATLSGLAMFSQITREQIRQNETGKVETSLNVMQQSAAEMVDKLNDIVWAVNPHHDSLVKLFQKLEEYAGEICTAKNITVSTLIDPDIEDVQLPMETRRSIYLLCKEAVNNAMKYSECTELFIRVSCTKEKLIFTIKDNGKGFDTATIKRGNGLNNMEQRALELNAILKVKSAAGIGTEIQLEHNLPH